MLNLPIAHSIQGNYKCACMHNSVQFIPVVFISDITKHPTPKTVFINTTVNFTCSGTGFVIHAKIDDQTVTASTKGASVQIKVSNAIRSLSLSVYASQDRNNSLITCFVATPSLGVESEPALLLIQGTYNILHIHPGGKICVTSSYACSYVYVRQLTPCVKFL